MTPFRLRISARRSALATMVLALTLLSAFPAGAQTGRRYDDPREMHLLPDYCKYTQDFRARIPGGADQSEIDRWTTIIGPTFIHMHHYCWGLMANNRAMFASHTQEERLHNLGVAIGEFNYVIQRAPADFGFLPEIYTKKGVNLIQLDKGPEGVGFLQRAVDLKPDYWPPYAAISDYYKSVGATAKAKDWLEKGLAAAPDTRALTRRLDELNAPQGKRSSGAQPSAVR